MADTERPTDTLCPDLGLMLGQARFRAHKSVEGAAKQTGGSIRTGGINKSDLSRLENNQLPMRRLPVTALKKLVGIYKCGQDTIRQIFYAYSCLLAQETNKELNQTLAEAEQARRDAQDEAEN